MPKGNRGWNKKQSMTCNDIVDEFAISASVQNQEQAQIKFNYLDGKRTWWFYME